MLPRLKKIPRGVVPRSWLLFFLLSLSSIAHAQFSVTESIPPAGSADFHYHFPINPGHPNLLAGTMGELRATHLHAGIDIRTNNMTGLPVVTAMKGYIWRAWISPF